MTKKALNQNGKYVQKLVDTIDNNFVFTNNPIKRLNIIKNDIDNSNYNKTKQLTKLRLKINSIENCN